MQTLRIGLSHGDDDEYGNYPKALRRIGAALGLDVEPVWLHDGTDHGPLDGILFTGGEDVDPARYGRDDARDLCSVDVERDAFEWGLIDAYRDLPTLAVCRGAQLFNVYRGGTLIPHLSNAHDHVRREGVDGEHAVAVDADSILDAFARVESAVNSAHHQAVDRLADGLRAIAHAPDGTIEAYVEAEPEERPFFLATQWHPERMAGRPLGDGPIGSFLKACAANARTGRG